MDCLILFKWDIILASNGEQLNFNNLVKTLRRCLEAAYSPILDNHEMLSTKALSQFLVPLSPKLNRRVDAVNFLSRPLSFFSYMFFPNLSAVFTKEVF